ncbi:unnamed protein product, partial [Meganyctiphanes norvegica]
MAAHIEVVPVAAGVVVTEDVDHDDAVNNSVNGSKTDEKMFSKSEEGVSYSSDEGAGIKMRKELGLLDGVGIIVGIIVGSGIFVSPKGVLEYSGSVGMALIVWAVSRIYIMDSGSIYPTVWGTMIPRSGGDYIYIYEAFGPLPAFLYLWVAVVIIMPTANTVIALAFANYILQPLFSHCDTPPDVPVRLIAAAVICFLTWVNCTNVKWATSFQNVFSMTKIFALIIIIATGIYHMGTGNTENFRSPMEGTNYGIGKIGAAFYQGLFSFAGWNYLNFVVEEIKDPYRNLPLAILISVPLVTFVYFMTNVAYFAILTKSEVLASNAVAVSLGDRMLGVMGWTMPFFVACSTFGSLNGGIFASSRLFFVGAREGHLPQALALINLKSFTPTPALIFLGFMTVFMLVSSNMQKLINYIAFTESLFILMSIAALLWLRYKQPNRKRPIKVWIGFPIIFFIICLFLVTFPVFVSPVELGVACVIISAGVPVYYFAIYREMHSKTLLGAIDNVTKMCQILWMSMPSKEE